MADDLNVKNRILDGTRELFFKYGYSRITMDDVASSIGISKKTLYKYFRSKEDLIREAILNLMQEVMLNITGIIHNTETEYLERLKQFMMFFGNFTAKISIQPLQDLQREVPHIYSEFESAREKFILANFRDFFQEGVQKGLIRNDINQEIILLIFINIVQAVINPKVLSEMPFTVKDAFDAIIKVIYNGILTTDQKI